jgi:CO/xanthine dehydrogenase Mo-binding subunit
MSEIARRHWRQTQASRGFAVSDRGGAYLDDLAFAGLTHAAILRSPLTDARIAGIDAATARAVSGGLTALTTSDQPVLLWSDDAFGAESRRSAGCLMSPSSYL